MTRNNEVKALAGRVKFYYSDRDCCLDFAKMLAYVSKKAGVSTESGQKWDMVIDFCAYHRKSIKSIVRGLANLVKLYIFISTDSVYDVCVKEIRDGFVKESDSLRPEKDQDIIKLAQQEGYGHNKLRCEEYLKSHAFERREIPYVIFRLPDVIGPYDSTNRYWVYLMWMMYMEKWPIHTQDKSETNKLSFVFSEDVAGFIHTLLPILTSAESQEFVDKVHGHAFNLAFDEVVTLNEFLRLMVNES